LWQTGNAAGF